MGRSSNPARWLFDSSQGPRTVLLARWLFLRALAAIFFSAFFSLLFQIKGLIGPQGILPAGETLAGIAKAAGGSRFWAAPSLFWISSSSHFVMAVTWLGLIASVAAFFNLWPRFSFFVCWVCFLAFVGAAGDFSSYQSDGMLLEAGFLSLFFAPPGLRPGLGRAHPPIRLSLWLLQWEWTESISTRAGVRFSSYSAVSPRCPEEKWTPHRRVSGGAAWRGGGPRVG
jgi:hypothetical protein